MEGYVADLRTYLNESKARETTLHERIQRLRRGDRTPLHHSVASPNPDQDPTPPLEGAHSLDELRQVTTAVGLGTSVLQDEGATDAPGTETRASKAKAKPKAVTKPKPTAKSTKAAAAKAAAAKAAAAKVAAAKAAAAKAAAAKRKGLPSGAQPKERGEDSPSIRTRQNTFFESVKVGTCNSAETEGDKMEPVEPGQGEASALWHRGPVGTTRDSTGSLLPIGGPLTAGQVTEEEFEPVDWGDDNESVHLESGEKEVQSEEEGDDENGDPEV
jgi:hypothetical protein